MSAPDTPWFPYKNVPLIAGERDVLVQLERRVGEQTLSVILELPLLRWLGYFSPGIWLLQTLPPAGWHSAVVPIPGGKDRPA